MVILDSYVVVVQLFFYQLSYGFTCVRNFYKKYTIIYTPGLLDPVAPPPTFERIWIGSEMAFFVVLDALIFNNDLVIGQVEVKYQNSFVPTGMILLQVSRE